MSCIAAATPLTCAALPAPATAAAVQAPKPSPGPHKTRECLPLILLLRNRLKYALTGKEVTSILMQRLVQVDGKVRGGGGVAREGVKRHVFTSLRPVTYELMQGLGSGSSSANASGVLQRYS